MRKREGDYEVSATSQAYDVGGNEVMLLPVRPYFLRRLNKRMEKEGMVEPDGDFIPVVIGMILEIAYSWDDPQFEFETELPPDPLKLDDISIVKLGIALLEEVDASPRVIALNVMLDVCLARLKGENPDSGNSETTKSDGQS